MPNSFRTCLSDVVGPIELAPSRWPVYLHLLAIILASIAIAMSGLTLIAQIAVLLAMAALARYEWRQWQRRVQISAIRFSPTLIEIFLRSGEQHIVEPPYRCLVTSRFVALQINAAPNTARRFQPTLTQQRWLPIFDGQIDQMNFCRLRRVLHLQRG